MSSPQNNSTTFLTLPLEIRRQVFDLLVEEEDRVVKIPRRGPLIHGVSDLSAQLLRACKQVHKEAAEELYSRNAFQTKRPQQLIEFVRLIGPTNVKHLRTLYLRMRWDSQRQLASWLQALNTLAREATGLLCIELNFDARGKDGYWDMGDRGLGDSLEFIRAFGKIKGLNKAVIFGQYGEQWPSYLERTMACPVKAYCGSKRDWDSQETYEHIRSRLQLEEGETEEEARAQVWGTIRSLYEQELLNFYLYQEGTEDLWP